MQTVWEMWTEGLTAAYCDQLIARGKQLPAMEAAIGQREDGSKMPEVRRSIVRWLDIDGADQGVLATIMYFAKRANRQSFGFDLTEPVEVQFTEYHGTNNGVYHWHSDLTIANVVWQDRKLSFIAQLSDPSDYEGGDLEFFGYASPGPDFKKKGSVIIFPSFLQHRVTPVTSGIRHSLVSWVEGPRFR
ncbi:MAG TPA: 2OG-Fe(II) oxygenase [Allosphingosinicella sp.]|jgi:PKHD-type hydroxylase